MSLQKVRHDDEVAGGGQHVGALEGWCAEAEDVVDVEDRAGGGGGAGDVAFCGGVVSVGADGGVVRLGGGRCRLGRSVWWRSWL